MKNLIYLLGFAVVCVLVARLIPADAEPHHEDPGRPDPQRSEVRLIGQDAPRYAATAHEVLEAFQQIATADFGVKRAAGSVDEGMITFVARSRVFGFRDYITAKAVDEPGGAKLALLARPRFNVYDWGVNAARLDRWLGEMEQTFSR